MCVISRLILNTKFFNKRILCTSIMSTLMIFSSVFMMTNLQATENTYIRHVTPRGDLASDEKNTIALFENSRDSVVYISTSSLVRDPWTRNVFSTPKGTGSGFIWDDIGHVVTNYHVITGANEAMVKLADGRDYKANLVGTSQIHDIAVLKIGVDFKRPPPVPIGTSDDLKVGQKVYAIGNPFGLDWTLTSGIVSALNRSLAASEGFSVEHLIQTDAAINPGNSGGPLLDSAGRLIGINTSIYSPSGASAGIGFAVPVDTVMRVVPELIKNGKYTPPALGIELDQQVNDRLTAMTGKSGVIILRVKPGSTAEKAGLSGIQISDRGWVAGDIIVAINDKEINSIQKLLSKLDDYHVGDRVKLTVIRNNSKHDIDVILQSGN